MKTRLICVCAAAAFGGLAQCAAAGKPASEADPVAAFIRENWATTIRSHAEDDGTLIGLPKPYTVPCASDMFQEMYYWDTYFTNVGLMLSDRVEQARRALDLLPQLEREYGLACSANRNLLNLQWDSPHGWACLQYLAIRGLERYGHRREAAKLAAKYVKTVRKVFAETGALWEKYDTERGAVSVTKEYESPKMLGWSAGVYLFRLGLIESAR